MTIKMIVYELFLIHEYISTQRKKKYHTGTGDMYYLLGGLETEEKMLLNYIRKHAIPCY